MKCMVAQCGNDAITKINTNYGEVSVCEGCASKILYPKLVTFSMSIAKMKGIK